MPTSGSTTYERRFYTYDPFGRLTAVHSNDAQTTLIAEYRYNGLGQRIMWRYDADASLSVGSAERYYYMYDGPAGGMHGWRMVGTFRDADSSPKESFVYHAGGMAGRVGGGSSSYIDAVVMRDRDANAGWTAASDGTLEERRYYTQNWRAEVVAVTKSSGMNVGSGTGANAKSCYTCVRYQSGEINALTYDSCCSNTQKRSMDHVRVCTHTVLHACICVGIARAKHERPRTGVPL